MLAVIVDAVLIIVLLYKDVEFSFLLFPTVFFINVCKIWRDLTNDCVVLIDGFLCWRKLSYFL